MPIVALEQKITRDVALTRADSFFRAHGLAPADARTAVRFQGNDSLHIFVELAGGGHDSLNALIRGRDVAPYFWSVRAFVPGDPREASVRFASDGRVIGFRRTLAETDVRPTVSVDSGRHLAETALAEWVEGGGRWMYITSSYETRKTSARIDRRYTYLSADLRIGGAPVRAEVDIAGDLVAGVRSYVDIPETFRRRYDEMRSANELLAAIAGVCILALTIAGIVFANRMAKEGALRWREPAIVGAVIGALTIAAGLNELPGSWFDYDTAMSVGTFQMQVILIALANGVFIGVVATLTLAAAEAATRRAFPGHLDWWKLWRYRGTKDVAARVGGGYAAACIAFAYVSVFYFVTRTLFGWWVPSEILDDPNQIASPIPWVSGIAISLNAGVWEEALFRALPLSLLSLWIGNRPRRTWWMALGVMATALVFGFAHSDYPSWPPYSRGLEIFIDACFWALLFLWFGLLVTVIAHFVYDLVLFGLFAASGSATEYRISAAIIAAALLAPALAVAWQWVRQRGLTTAPDDARFLSWMPERESEEATSYAVREPRALARGTQQFAAIAVVAAIVVAMTRAPQRPLGPRFTADRTQVGAVADSMLRARGGDPARWRRLIDTANDTLVQWPRFARAHKVVDRMQDIASSYVVPTWWIVRYVQTTGTAAQRTEEWRIRVKPDGQPFDTRHLIADSARAATVDADSVRRVALAALARERIASATLQETEFTEVARPARRDVTVTYTDTAMHLPAGAAARARVVIAGDEPILARRALELPEAFLRQDRELQTRRAMITGLYGLLVLGAVITGAFMITRKRAPVVNDGQLDRRASILFVVALSMLGILDQLNGLPSSLASYDTSEPWGRFLGTTAMGFVSVIPMSLFVLGVWLAMSALRRRVGIPMLSNDRRETLVAGLGLGAMSFVAVGLPALVARGEVPPTPSTTLGLAVPMLDHLAGMPSSTLMMVAVAAIPVLVLLGSSARWRVRLLILGVALGLGVAALALAPSSGAVNPARVAAGVGALGLVALAIYLWGGVSAAAWVVAALATQALGGLRDAVYAPTSQEQVAGVLTLLVGLGLVVIIARVCHPERSEGSAPL